MYTSTALKEFDWNRSSKNTYFALNDSFFICVININPVQLIVCNITNRLIIFGYDSFLSLNLRVVIAALHLFVLVN